MPDFARQSSGGKAMKRSGRQLVTNPPDRLGNVHQKRTVESSPGGGNARKRRNMFPMFPLVLTRRKTLDNEYNG